MKQRLIDRWIERWKKTDKLKKKKKTKLRRCLNNHMYTVSYIEDKTKLQTAKKATRRRLDGLTKLIEM